MNSSYFDNGYDIAAERNDWHLGILSEQLHFINCDKIAHFIAFVSDDEYF